MDLMVEEMLMGLVSCYREKIKSSFVGQVSSTLSDYIITVFLDRHSGMDSHQAILPDALRVNANLFQTDLCRNPAAMDGFEITIHGTGYPLPGGHDELEHNLTK
jgi:hypothetical protein